MNKPEKEKKILRCSACNSELTPERPIESESELHNIALKIYNLGVAGNVSYEKLIDYEQEIKDLAEKKINKCEEYGRSGRWAEISKREAIQRLEGM